MLCKSCVGAFWWLHFLLWARLLWTRNVLPFVLILKKLGKKCALKWSDSEKDRPTILENFLVRVAGARRGVTFDCLLC